MRTIVCGDVHGCIEELDEVVRTSDYRRGRDRLIMLGDMIDRGPDPVGVVRRVRELGGESVFGNHEEHALRWLRHEDVRKKTGKKNPIMSDSITEDRMGEWKALSEDDRSWLSSLPLTIVTLGWIVVHAGLEPAKRLEDQDENVMKIRFVDRSGLYVKLGPKIEQPPDTVHWSDMWIGPRSVVYGHHVHSLQSPACTDRTTKNGRVQCLGLDTGCVFGGHLSAAILRENSGFDLVQVPARRTYYPGRAMTPTDPALVSGLSLKPD